MLAFFAAGAVGVVEQRENQRCNAKSWVNETNPTYATAI